MTWKTLKTTGLLASALIVGLAAAGGTASAQGRTLTISVLHGDDRPQARIWYRFADLVEEELPGEYDLRIVTNAALGGERETAEGVRLGSIQGGMSTLANLGAWVPEAQVFDMPFIFEDEAHIARVAESDIGQDMLDKLAAEGFRGLGYVVYGARHLLSTQPLSTPEEVSGVSMRVIQSPLHVELWRSLGASPTPVPIPEAYGALETGVVNLMDFTKAGYESFRLYEVAPYLVETGHIWSMGVLYFSEDLWQTLPQEHQVVFQEAAATVIDTFNRETAEEDEASLERAVAAGAEAIQPDRAAWQAAIRPFWEDFAGNVGGIELVESIAAMK